MFLQKYLINYAFRLALIAIQLFFEQNFLGYPENFLKEKKRIILMLFGAPCQLFKKNKFIVEK